MRCAIYTRKSTNEGLDQDFNSLDAQREACVNYILSQKHEGWTLLPEYYDDGGYTGANMDRPALKQLISDIETNKIDCIVVYKVDRLSRSLLDFSKLLEHFDKHKVTFVSVTQHFNTNSSMGRLTLHILLSFAQFEREIISERTKDKVSAARKRGQWTGGYPMLGYDLDRAAKKLVINPEEAILVKDIFETYAKKCSLLRVADILNSRGCKTKSHTSKNGRVFGGRSYDKNEVGKILSSFLYIGKIEFKNEIYAGQHSAIIEEDLFYQVQRIKTENMKQRDRKKTKQNVGLLKHILWCKPCNRMMIPTYTCKKKKKYRYYLCNTANRSGYDKCPTKSVNAHEIEKAVLKCLREIIVKENITQAAVVTSALWDDLFSCEQRRILNLIVERVDYDGPSENISITINQKGLQELADEVRV
ncbi:MAG: recombinase family protein [Proteobacteria bacterium]|nr:recombinase family protein [Pseudomonadota bacterium]